MSGAKSVDADLKLERRTVLHVTAGPHVAVRMQVIGPDGGCEFHFTCHNEEARRYGEGAITPGGFECHFKAHSRPDYYAEHEKPHRTDCSVTGGDCWHDGTSLWASEHWLPGMAHGGEEWVWRELEAAYRDKIAATVRIGKTPSPRNPTE